MPEILDYRPPGPTMKRFHESTSFFRACAGPIGSGKTTSMIVADPVFGGMIQLPNSQGVRTFKFGVIRDTYRNLYATTMKTWLAWFPKDIGDFQGSDDRPASHRLELVTQDMHLSLEAEFRALGANSVEAVCRGWELNGAMVDEADTVPEEAPTFLGGRVMRAGDVNLRQTRGVSLAFNKPDVDHPLYRWCEEGAMEGLEFFDQPPGLLPGLPYRANPNAENAAHLDPDYYVKAAMGQPEWYVRRMLRNQWGASVSGEVIYPSFSRERHVLPADQDPPPGSVLRIGADGGGTPAAVIVGRDRIGRRIVYDELVLVDPYDPTGWRLLHGVGPKRFGEALRDLINEPRYRGCRFEIGYGDPAAFYGADREAGEYSFMETAGMTCNVPMVPAESNEVWLRHDAVKALLNETAVDGLPMLMINPRCRFLTRGFTSDYKWEAHDPKQPGKTLKAQKSRTSHVHDALQYECLGDLGRAAVVAGRRFDRHDGRLPVAEIQRGPSTGQTQLASLVGRKLEVPGTTYKVDFSPWR